MSNVHVEQDSINVRLKVYPSQEDVSLRVPDQKDGAVENKAGHVTTVGPLDVMPCPPNKSVDQRVCERCQIQPAKLQPLRTFAHACAP